MNKKEVILTTEQLVYRSPERLDVFYSDGQLYYRVGINVEVGAANKNIEGVIDIPSEVTINGRIYEVSGIGDFLNCHNITSVKIPDSVNWVNNSAFMNCCRLKAISIPSNLTHLGKGVFLGCSRLEEIKVSKQNQKFDSRNNCNAIIETATNTLVVGCKTTVMPKGVSSIGDYAFWENKSITKIIIPESITSINKFAFHGCSGLTSISIPYSVVKIGGGAFDGCGLESVVIPKTIIQGGSSFQRCKQLKSIVVEEENPVYDSRNNCNAIIETANNRLLCGCKTTIIPDSVRSIGGGAFAGQEDIVSIIIPKRLEEIGVAAFRGCKGLKSFIIPASVKSIGNMAFLQCENLSTVYSYIKDPEKCNVHIAAFIGQRNKSTLFVPKGTAELYRNRNDGWKLFKDIQEFDSDSINNRSYDKS